jgi:hypothetical protein
MKITRLISPDAPWTRFRRWLSATIEPRPSAGEAWCMDCVLNAGRTRIVSSSGASLHVERHHEEDPGGELYVIARDS